jgi:hypothetical protein
VKKIYFANHTATNTIFSQKIFAAQAIVAKITEHNNGTTTVQLSRKIGLIKTKYSQMAVDNVK